MSLFTPNTSHFDDFYQKEKFLLAWRVSLVFSIVFFILAIIQFYLNLEGLIPVLSTFVIGLTSTVYLYFTKNYKAIFWVYALAGSLISFFAMNNVMKTSHYVDFIWIITSILIALIGIGKKEGIFFIGLNFIGICYFYFYTINKLVVTLQPKPLIELFSEFGELLFAFSVISYLLYKFSFFQNRSSDKLRIAKENVAITSNENEVLVKEIHHRVKNNLQIIISLLRLQRNELKSEESKEQFSEAINRIMVMSLIHQKLYQDKSLAEIKIKDYLTDLTCDIKSLSTLKIPIKINVQSGIDVVGLKTIVPLGLIVNELMTNSLEHAFNNKTEALIHVSVKEKENSQIELIYFDNGEWIKKGENYSSFGLELIEILTSQLEGVCSRNVSANGTSFEFLLKNIDLEK